VTVQDALREATDQLRSADVDSPEHDAEVLLRHVLGWDRARILADGAATLPPGAEASYREQVGQRARRRPLQHLTGCQWFWKHEFTVTADVLVPRPETELLVEAGLDLLRDVESPRIVDVGTGSGCIALSLAAERPDAEVHATDISGPALAVARENALRLGLEARVSFHLGDLLEPMTHLAGEVDLVVSNPPYVDSDELPSLTPEVREHEPREALVPPGDRASLYRRLGSEAAELLRPGRWLGVEIGQGMSDEVSRALAPAGLRVERVVPDLAGIPRALIAVRPLGE